MPKRTFADRYTAGEVEPTTAYQRRIANGIDRGLSVSQARGHARTSKNEPKISELKVSGKLPPISRRERFTKVVNHRWVTHEFGTNPDPRDMAEYLTRIAKGDSIDIQMVVHGYSEHHGKRIPKDAIEIEYHSRIERILVHDDLSDDELEAIAERLERLDDDLRRYGIAIPQTAIRVRHSFGKPVA